MDHIQKACYLKLVEKGGGKAVLGGMTPQKKKNKQKIEAQCCVLRMPGVRYMPSAKIMGAPQVPPPPGLM